MLLKEPGIRFRSGRRLSLVRHKSETVYFRSAKGMRVAKQSPKRKRLFLCLRSSVSAPARGRNEPRYEAIFLARLKVDGPNRKHTSGSAACYTFDFQNYAANVPPWIVLNSGSATRRAATAATCFGKTWVNRAGEAWTSSIGTAANHSCRRLWHGAFGESRDL